MNPSASAQEASTMTGSVKETILAEISTKVKFQCTVSSSDVL